MKIHHLDIVLYYLSQKKTPPIDIVLYYFPRKVMYIIGVSQYRRS